MCFFYLSFIVNTIFYLFLRALLKMHIIILKDSIELRKQQKLYEQKKLHEKCQEGNFQKCTFCNLNDNSKNKEIEFEYKKI